MSFFKLKQNYPLIEKYTSCSDYLYDKLRSEPTFKKNHNDLITSIKIASTLDLDEHRYIRVCNVLCFLHTICTAEGLAEYSKIFDTGLGPGVRYKSLIYGNVFVDQFNMMYAMKLYYTLKHDYPNQLDTEFERTVMLCYLIPKMFKHPNPKLSNYYKQLKTYCDFSDIDYAMFSKLYEEIKNEEADSSL